MRAAWKAGVLIFEIQHAWMNRDPAPFEARNQAQDSSFFGNAIASDPFRGDLFLPYLHLFAE